MLQNLLESIKIQVVYFMYLTLPGDEEEYAKTHQDLLDILKEGNPEKSVQTMQEHIITTAESAIEKLEIE